MREILLRETAGVGAAIAAQHGGRVVPGVEADAKQMSLGIGRLVCGQSLVDLREVRAHFWAEVSQRAASVDECHQHDFAAVAVQVDGLTALIEQMKIRHGVARRGHVVLHRRTGVWLRLPDHHEVIQTQVERSGCIFIRQATAPSPCHPGAVRLRYWARPVCSGMVTGAHKAGDGVVADCHLAGCAIDRHNAAPQMIVSGFLRGRMIGAAAA